MDTLSSIIWVGLGILLVSGVALFIPESARLLVSSKFLLKVVVVSVITINGIALNMFVAPHLRRLSFLGDAPTTHFRRIAFALGGISIVSWYSAFLLGSFRKIPLDFSSALLLYSGLIVFVIISSQVFERIVTHTRNKVRSLD